MASKNSRRRPSSAPNLTMPSEVSERIDEELKREAALLREQKRKEIQVLLLGQAESGKSTLQKQFQLLYAQQSLESERPSWRPAVYFNIIKAVRMILSELEYEFSARTEGNPYTTDEVVAEINRLRSALLPLVAIEDSLASEINGGVSIPGGRSGAFVRSGWQNLRPDNGQSVSEPRGFVKLPETANIAAKAISRSTVDITALWQHRTVQRFIEDKTIRLDESAAFFLTHVDRISEPGYLPTTDDILRVRLRTLGVIEHNFAVATGGKAYNWRLFDVGGARGQRQAWVPYFDDAVSIIFLAPISAFDQYLEEDAKVNRIDDSLQLFTMICQNKIFKDVHLVLMLNKTDLLKKKLAAGIRIRKYITSYSDRPNTYEAAASYFRSHFVHSHRKHSDANRSLYYHFTSMLDVKATQKIIVDVGESILQKHIKRVGLI
ncbi:guanine nucleotide binding protein, alpha subunit [Ephemerocybe angulata]|uniref:Guanine nucleotide binding protein, alpha subunit n=1 Tax=Ephemerocybe angulata TaxID=980116 RepID=A0A8H6LXM0_9AGAR|nr:guanine nucleotide binding protein, alpha subunit [Tulosesus angulatus]